MKPTYLSLAARIEIIMLPSENGLTAVAELKKC